MTGRFITFEGGEGAGKTTQIRHLRRRLEAEGADVVVTREPGGSERAEAIRGSVLAGQAKRFGPFAEALMFSSARRDHLDALIRPALARGALVLCDRYMDSTRAYQGALGAMDPMVLRALERVVVNQTLPDLTFILDLPAEIGLSRASARQAGQGSGADRFEAEDLTFHRRLRQAFLDIAAAEPERCVVIDATGDAETLAEAIWTLLRSRIPSIQKTQELEPDVGES